MVDFQCGDSHLPNPGQLAEITIQVAPGLIIQREVINLCLFQGSQPVIDTAIDIDHLAVALDKRDGRQEASTLQPVAVEI